jgi:2-polyprenyl-6-methoxyphenol hydroxylase-like FAD-dependent oxidoreductase
VVSLGGSIIARFDSTGDVADQSITSEFEILRADLARVFVDAATSRPGVKIVYGDYISAISQSDNGTGPVWVEFANGKLPAAEYDLVVGADGVLSKTRALATGRPAKADAHDIGGFYIAYFTIPRSDRDSPTHARYWNSTCARVVMTRPSPAGTGVLLQFQRPELDGTETLSLGAQKELVASIFAGAGWETPRILEAMKTSDDFYCERLAHVKCKRWSVGRVALVGDAAYGPSSFTGMGTSLALYGAYVLAGELNHAIRNGRSVTDALTQYESVARPYVDRIKPPLRVANMRFPQTWRGVWVLNTMVRVFYLSGIMKVLLRFKGENEVEPLPEYKWSREKQ